MIVMQKGFATLEVILAILIVSVLMTCAVPNAAKIIDTVALDYESKRLYSDLRFAQALSRSATTSDIGMTNLFNKSGILMPQTASLKFSYPDKGVHSWQIVRGSEDNAPAVRKPHVLSYGVKIIFERKQEHLRMIKFNSTGEVQDISNNAANGHIILESRNGKRLKFIFDNVGRFRVEKYD